MSIKVTFINPVKILLRNRYTREGAIAKKNRVNLERFRDKVNLGDYLSEVICEYMLAEKSMGFSDPADGTKHLMAVGSILGGRGDFDVVVWGSGIMNFSAVCALYRRKLYQKLDIRAVRGPLTRTALQQIGISCPEVFGDPAVLMPRIYPRKAVGSGKTVYIPHYLTDFSDCGGTCECLDIKTEDYKGFIDQMCTADKVISSSLHGIILAEAYGIPSVFLNQNRDREILKYFDWYYSTGRYSIRMAATIEEAMRMDPMPLPQLEKMQEQLTDTFPYDLWKV